MTSNERIERLLNYFGQTISDLHGPGTINYSPNLQGTIAEWATEGRISAATYNNNSYFDLSTEAYEDYICYLSDIIDRMENALDTAARTCLCENCENHMACLDIHSPILCPDLENNNFRIADELLND